MVYNCFCSFDFVVACFWNVLGWDFLKLIHILWDCPSIVLGLFLNCCVISVGCIVSYVVVSVVFCLFFGYSGSRCMWSLVVPGCVGWC